MARKSSRRRREEEEEGEDQENPEDEPQQAPPPAGGRATLPAAMRQRNRAVAEREASRLARPERRKVRNMGHASRLKSAVSSTPSGYHPLVSDDSNEVEEWCGPFSVARQMISKREEARRQREEEQRGKAPHPMDEMMEQVDVELKRKAQPSLQWKSNLKESSSSKKTSSYYAKRQKRVELQDNGVVSSSLFQLCVKYLVDNFEYVEALGDVDSSIRRVICEELVAENKMNGQAFDAVAEAGIEALELVDCAEITEDQFSQSLQKLLPAGLRFLLLHHAGRCFGPKAVQAIVNAPIKSLFAISVSGAYLLKDEDAASLISKTATTISSVEFKACPLLGLQFCKTLGTAFASPSEGNLLELSLEELPLKKENILLLAKSSDALRNLKSLTLRQVEAVDDEVVLALLEAVGDRLEGIDLSFNHNLTDDMLSGIRRCNTSGSLRSLQLCGLKNLTEVGLEALFTLEIQGLPPPPMLRKLNLAECDFDAVTDQVLCLAADASSMKRDDGTVSNVLSSMGGLVHVNVNGSSCSDRSMERLAATSASSLRELDVSFSPNISDKGLGYLVSKAGPQLAKLHIWGCAQITDDFLDGHSRVGDTKFEAIGAWMKKSGGLSVR